jgi:hypothetical protein
VFRSVWESFVVEDDPLGKGMSVASFRNLKAGGKKFAHLAFDVFGENVFCSNLHGISNSVIIVCFLEGLTYFLAILFRSPPFVGLLFARGASAFVSLSYS